MMNSNQVVKMNKKQSNGKATARSNKVKHDRSNRDIKRTHWS